MEIILWIVGIALFLHAQAEAYQAGKQSVQNRVIEAYQHIFEEGRRYEQSLIKEQRTHADLQRQLNEAIERLKRDSA